MLGFEPQAVGHDRGRHGRRGGGRLIPRDRIGIQLFTVRDQVAALGFEAVFARLSQIGYREIEFAGYSAQGRRWTNQELRRLLRRYGLMGVGSHVNLEADVVGKYVERLMQPWQDKEVTRPERRTRDAV